MTVKKQRMIPVALLALTIAACAGGEPPPGGEEAPNRAATGTLARVDDGNAPALVKASREASFAAADAAAAEGPGSNGMEVRSPAGRHIIREIGIDLEVDDVAAARRGVAALAERAGGFVSHLSMGRTGTAVGRAQLTLRVPSDRVGAMSADLADIGTVLSERHGSQDITQQYLDTETRLRVLRETDARLRGILAERTGKLADVLQVERELARVITDIERLEGQRRFWDEQVALATVHVTLAEPVPVIQAGWTAPVVEAFRASLGVLARSAGAVITLIAGALPFAVLGLVGWALWRGFRRSPSVTQRSAA